eukprot:XP_015581195.1 uncharacterized protein LOC107262091 [Ricinus communis]
MVKKEFSLEKNRWMLTRSIIISKQWPFMQTSIVKDEFDRDGGKKKALALKVCLKSTSINLWHVDNGCSKLILGDKNLFVNVKNCNGGKVIFRNNAKGKDNVIFKEERSGNTYTIGLHKVANQSFKCVVSISDESWL